MQTMRESWTDERLDEFGKRIDERFDRVDERFDDVDRRFNEVDAKFTQVDKRFDAVQREMRQGFEQVDKRLDRLADGLESVQKAIIFGAVTMSSVVGAGLIALISQG